jgi:hypothetical protein
MKMDHMRFLDHTEKQKYNKMNKYPQVRKTGVDAVHESCSQMVYIMKELQFVTCVIDD